MSDPGVRDETPGPLAILAGGGAFPTLVASAARAQGRQVIIAAIRGEAEAGIEVFPHRWIGRGQLGTLLALLRRHRAHDLVIVGAIRQRRLPRLDELDFGALWVLLRHIRILRHGDDGLLRKIARIFESRGIRVVGAAEVAPELLMPSGPLGGVRPSAAAQADIALGLAAARAHGARDLGQAVIAVDGHIAAREGRAGTDAMLAAHAAQRVPGASPAGVLIKCPKPDQDRRLDMPAIGLQTVAEAIAAGLAGIAVEAGGTLVADRAEMVAAADRAGLFVWGITPGDRDDAGRGGR